MNNEELNKLTDCLGALHYNLPTTNPNRNHLYRDAVIRAIEELKAMHFRGLEAKQTMEELTNLRAASKKQRELIRELEQRLSESPSTSPTVAAGSLQRGAEELPEG